jgi:hypothetical protein
MAGVHQTHSCLLVKGRECRVPTVCRAEDDVAAARTRVHYTHSCLPASLQCREQKATWQQPWQGYAILTAVYLRKEARAASLQCREQKRTWQQPGQLVHHTHSCLPVKGGEGHVPTVQRAEDYVTAARAAGTPYSQLFTCERRRGPRPYSAGSRRRRDSSQGSWYTILTAVYL